MENTYFYEASLEDSYIYRTFNESSNMIDRIIKYLKTGIAITPEEPDLLESQFSILSKSHISPLYQKVMEAYNDGYIELIFSRETKVGITIPYIIRRNKGKIVATIFLASFSHLNKEQTALEIDCKNLYVLMESAFIALELQKPNNRIQRSLTLMKLCNSIYTSMILRTLNKDYALTIDKPIYDKVSFTLSKFFLKNVWGNKNDELCTNYAVGLCLSPNAIDMEDINNSYNEIDPKTIQELIEFLKTITPRMNNLSIRYFMERFLNMYSGSTIISIDYLPYLFYIIENILCGSYLIGHGSINDIIKNTKGINSFYSELSKLL